MNRRQFLCRATAAVLLPVADGVIAQGASTASTVVSSGAQRSLLKRNPRIRPLLNVNPVMRP